ncbi:MAG: hypothetical protein JO161_02070 [Planctomycetaceae bacterium]|nr:hypothetical protein [Planctomycetaceae bacterium]
MVDLTPLVQTVIGGGLTLAGGVLGQWIAFRRERHTKRIEIEEHHKRQRFDFQIKSLTKLQGALCRIMKAAYPIADIDYHATFSGVERDLGKSRRLWKEWQDSLAVATIYSARVEDGSVREAVSEVLKMASELVIPLSRKGSDLETARDEAEALRDELVTQFNMLNQRIGECLRKLY